MPEARYLPGDVVLVPFPYTDLSAAKQRPALVLTNAPFNGGSQDLVLCAITSNLANSANSVLLADADMESGRLAAPSRVKVAKVVTLHKSILRKKVGRVKAAAFAQVMREFETLYT